MANAKELTYEDGFMEGFDAGRDSLLEMITGGDNPPTDAVAWMYIRESGVAHITFTDAEVREPYTKIPLYMKLQEDTKDGD